MKGLRLTRLRPELFRLNPWKTDLIYEGIETLPDRIGNFSFCLGKLT